RTETGDRENPTAPRPHHAARQCRKENRPCRVGGISVCWPALRALDRGGFETARPRRIILGNLCVRAPSNSCATNNARRPKAPGATGVSNHVRSIERGNRRGKPVEQRSARTG